MTDQPPKIDNAPGLKWTRRKAGWEARWRARSDLVRAGFGTRSVPLWKDAGEPNEAQVGYIVDQCKRLQAQMLTWASGGIRELAPEMKFDGTLKSLIRCYETDPDSGYQSLRFQSRRNSDYRCKRLIADYGSQTIADIANEDGAPVDGIDARMLKRWHRLWSENGHTATAHSLIGMLRTLMGFGATFLKSSECARVRVVLSAMKFKMNRPRGERLTADQAIAIRAAAHAKGLHSIALAQAFQFEVMLRQKDVIGEWIPTAEPGLSDVTAGNDKWMCGLRWSEIDGNLILRHTTSKRQKDIEVDLRLAPMVMEEFEQYQARIGGLPLPVAGPIVVYERTSIPYEGYQFRLEWRRLAKMLGIPAEVYNMDSRAGAISEATDAGAELEHVRHAATHSNITTTQGYSRGGTEKIAGVMRTRVAHRNKT